LRRWRKCFDTAIEGGQLPTGFDQIFIDFWCYYLMYSEGGFSGGEINVVKVTLVES
jgi:cyclopropane-fatty-acyl-phospholipid synthase